MCVSIGEMEGNGKCFSARTNTIWVQNVCTGKKRAIGLVWGSDIITYLYHNSFIKTAIHVSVYNT